MLRTSLTALFLVVPIAAHAQWQAAESDHFIVYSEASAEKLKDFTESLERYDQALRAVTGTPDRKVSRHARVSVYFVDDTAEIQKLIGQRNVAGFFKPRASGSVAFVPRNAGNSGLGARAILQHEYAHNFMFSSWPGVVFAPWFVEGFAEFVATAYSRPDGSMIIGKSPDYRAGCVAAANVLPARQLVKLDTGKLDEDQRCVLYARGWLLTHYLLLGGHANQLIQYIGAINAHESVDEANAALGDLDSLDGKITAYAKRGSLPATEVKPEKLAMGTIAIRALSRGESAIMPALILSTNGVDKEQAKTVVALARRLAAPYPNDAGAQNELAEAEYDAGNYAEAEAAADRAIAADPKSVHALLYKGMASEEIARRAGDKDPAKWRAIRSAFLSANKLDTEYAEPLIQFYNSFPIAGQLAPKNAQDGLVYAYALAPYDQGLRMNAGLVLLEQGNGPAARVAFEPVAFGPHRGEFSDFAEKVIAALDTGGPSEALKMLRKRREDGNVADKKTEPKEK